MTCCKSVVIAASRLLSETSPCQIIYLDRINIIQSDDKLTRCYLLGAGASHGYDESLPKEWCPPLGTEFFTKGSNLNIFTKERYPQLLKKFQQFLSTKTTANDMLVDIEEFLQGLVVEFRKQDFVSFSSDPANDPAMITKKALGESYFFSYELFRHYALHYSRKINNYSKLAFHHLKHQYNLITLNYDTLFEIAIKNIYLRYHYFPEESEEGSISIAKIHGSINWLNPAGSPAVVTGIPPWDNLFGVITLNIFSNRFIIAPDGTNPIAIRTDEIPPPRDRIINSITDWYEPALIPPLADYKDYSKIHLFDKAWNFAETMLKDATELVIIGCSLRTHDSKLKELLQTTIPENIPITIVDLHPEVISKKLQTLLSKPNFSLPFLSFTEYTQHLDAEN